MGIRLHNGQSHLYEILGNESGDDSGGDASVGHSGQVIYYEVPFEIGHLGTLKLQPDQEWIRPFMEASELKFLENEWASTLMRNGVPIACAGALVHWKDRAQIWSYISGGHEIRSFFAIHKHAITFLNGIPFKRLEAIVDYDFKAGHRWISLLGFNIEAARMKSYQIDGRDASLYSLVRK